MRKAPVLDRAGRAARRVRLLMSGSALVLVMIHAPAPAGAQQTGGNGGTGIGGLAGGGLGGQTNAVSGGATHGDDGGPSTGGGNGGGGGGAGVTGGQGGAGSESVAATPGGAGGAGGTAAIGGIGGNGDDGGASLSAGVPGGGGGGGGGAHGAVGTSIPQFSLTGGNGGAGGDTRNSGGGGGGGGGGYGAFVTNDYSGNNGVAIQGGAGGAGGNTGVPGSAGNVGRGGNGGAGGVGLYFGGTAQLTNTGSIYGGNGGAAGTAPFGASGTAGAGGAGVVGAGLTIDNTGGTITGGLSGDGVTRADAITFTGGTNTLTLFGSQSLTGNIGIATGATLQLDQSTSLVLSNIITGGGSLTKTGSADMTLTGVNNYTGGTTISAGVLGVMGAGTLGSGSVTVEDGATLLLTVGGVVVSNPVTLNGAGSADGGALQGMLGINRVTGAITLGSASRINTVSGTLLLEGAITGVDTDLTFGGAGINYVDGDITLGTGGLIKDGSGTLRITGASSYSGATTINNGTLSISNSAAIPDASAVIVNAAGTLQVNTTETIGALAGSGNVVINSSRKLTIGADNRSTVFSGAISENAAGAEIIKTGSGTLTLSGANTYSGTTSVTGGALRIEDAAALGSTAGGTTVASGAALQIANGIIVSGEALTLNGAGNANSGALRNMSGANTYDGAITLGSATRINSDSGILFLQSIAGANTDLVFGGAGSVSLGGNIATGTGSLTKDGSGLLYLASAADYTGATTVNDGSLILTFGGSLSSNSAVIVNAPGQFELWTSRTIGSLSGAGGVSIVGGEQLSAGADNRSTTFSGVISENGGAARLAKVGTGTFTLANTNTYTGATTVDGGTLSVNGSIASSSMTTVNAGGALGGTGIVGNTTINGGTLAPGNSIGTLTVQGNLVLTSASRYMVEVSPTNADRVDVTGTATLGGATVNASFAPGSYVTKQYTIVNAAGGVIGTFGSQVNTDLPSNFKSSLSYDGNNAYLNLTLDYTPPVPPGPTPPVYVPLNGNQANVSSALIGSFNRTGGIPLVFGALNAQGLSQASGELGTGSQQTAFDAMNLFVGVMTDPFAAGRGEAVSGIAAFADEASRYAGRRKPVDAFAAITKAPPMAPMFQERWNVWAAGFGGSRSTDGNTISGSNNTTSSIYGTAIGADYWLSPNTIAGFALAGGGTNFSVNGGGSGRSDLFQAGTFVRHTVGSAYVTAAAAYGWQDVTTDRMVAAAGFERLHAQYNAHAYSGRIEMGSRFVTSWLSGFGLTPYGAVQATAFDLPTYAETGAGGATTFALAYAGRSVTSTRGELGLRSDKSFALTDAILTLRGRAAWAHDFNTDRGIAATFRALPGASFVVNGAAQARNAALATASAEMKWMNGWAVAATFEGEFSDVTRSYSGKGVVRYAW